MKKIGFLSFGHWTPSPQSRTQSATDALLQSIDLAVEAERLGMDGGCRERSVAARIFWKITIRALAEASPRAG
jgi:hypothetical protein